MSETMTTPAATPLIEGMAVRERVCHRVTVRVSQGEGIQWLALDHRQRDGTTRSIGLPVTPGLRAWLAAALIETTP